MSFRNYPARQLTSFVKRGPRASSNLVDSHGRVHNYLRISLTERCNLRCKYCMPAEGIHLTERDNLLQQDELKFLTQIFVKDFGFNKIRLTGGEPTIDAKLVPLLEHLGELKQFGLESIAMTTNGLKLKRNASLYKRLGVDYLNISLDSLRADKYKLMTRFNGLPLLLDGLKQALRSDFSKLKLNCVVIRNYNDEELGDFCKLAFEHPIEVRFIEFMPFFGNKWNPDLLVPYKEMLSKVQRIYPNLECDQGSEVDATSKVFRDPKMLGSIGFITSMTQNFCSGCNRLRLTADGQLKVCLFDRRETSLRDLIRNGANHDDLVRTIQAALQKKQKQHAVANAHRYSLMSQARFSHSYCDGTNRDRFSHLDESRREAKMVNVGTKIALKRIALARGEIFVGARVLDAIRDNSDNKKGNIVAVSKVAGIMGAKKTSDLIPMCHQIPLDHIEVNIHESSESLGCLIVEAKVECIHKTGVEMECLMAVSISLLTIYDMCKSVSKSMRIKNIELVSKEKTPPSS